MTDQNDDLIPPRAPPEKQFAWAIPLVCAVVGLTVFFFLNFNQETQVRDPSSRLSRALQAGYEIPASGHLFRFRDHSWRQFESEFVLSGEVVLARQRGSGTVHLDASLLYKLCAAVLTKVAMSPDAPTKRSKVFRLSLRIATSEESSGNPPTARINVPTPGGACPTQAEIANINYNTFPGNLKDWGFMGFYEVRSPSLDDPDIAAVFASRTGRLVPPLPFDEACRAARFDFAEVAPNAEQPLAKVAVMFLSKTASEVLSPEGEQGVGKNFTINGEDCFSSSNVYQLLHED